MIVDDRYACFIASGVRGFLLKAGMIPVLFACADPSAPYVLIN